MSDRPAPILEAQVCPFVAFDDDRDRRSDEPDHRHRCFAEARPAPRALAHQHAYCLSSSFPACPTFQDWARREAARAEEASTSRDVEANAVRDARAAAIGQLAAEAGELTGAAPASALPPGVASWEPASEGRPRQWAAPPPWLGGPEPAAQRAERERAASDEPIPDEEGSESAAQAPAFLARRERVPEPVGTPSGRPTPPDPDRGFFATADDEAAPWADDLDPGARGRGMATRTGRGAALTQANIDDADDESGTRNGPPPRNRSAGRSIDASRRRQDDSPAWEPRRRVEAYPAIRTRISLPRPSGIGLALLAIFVAAVALFFVPMLFAPKQSGTPGGAGESSSPSAPIVSPSSQASAIAPSPTAQGYIVKSGDTLSRIAKRLGVTLDQLISANPQLKDPNKLQIGDQLNVPTPVPSEIPNGSVESPSPSPS